MSNAEIEEDESDKLAVGVVAFSTLWQLIPGWGFSFLFHLAGLVALAAFTITLQREPKGIFEVNASNASPEEVFNLEIGSSAGSPGESAMIEESSLAEKAPELFSPEVPLTKDEVNLLSAAEPSMMSPLDALREAAKGGGGKATGLGVGMTSVFGVRTKGKRFAYVADNSNSMSKGRLEATIQEIQDSIGMLQPDQSFYVVFYSDTAYPLFHPRGAKTFVPATPENKEKLREWMKTVEHCLHTRGEAAMELVMKLKPDVVYLMGDGAFTDQTVEKTLEREDSRVLIHTFGFDMTKDRDKEGFEAIAKHFRGEFHDAKVAPEFLVIERQNKRPRNTTHNGLWGTTLPFEKKE